MDPDRVTEGVSPFHKASGVPEPAGSSPPGLGGGLSGSAVGDFLVETYIGAGGMGQVYRAFDTKLKRPVALKFLKVGDPLSVARFLREAQSQAGIQHENVCPVHTVGEHSGMPFIAMKFIDGVPLQDAAPGMSLEERVRVMQAVAGGLAAAHRMGVIHRDIKPGNVLVERQADGTFKPYLLDFGLAREWGDPRLTTSGEIMGTPLYMAPELLRGDVKEGDFGADVYGFGATLYEVLCGRPIFEAARSSELFAQVLSKDPVTLRRVDGHIPGDLETITMKCLEKDPRRRYGSAQEVEEELARFLASEPIRARRAGWPTRLAKSATRHKAAAAVSALSLLLLLSLGGTWGYTRWREAQKARLMSELGQEMGYIRTRLNFIRASPLHDVRAEEAEIRKRLEGIELAMNRGRSYARGPYAWALGQGALLFQDFEKARRYLEEAWGRHRVRTPEVAFALGLTYAELFEKAMYQIENYADQPDRSRRVRLAERQFRDPAKMYLGRGRGVLVDAPDFVEAKLALLAGDESGALRLARQAVLKAPWFYEGKLLVGDIHWSMALRRISGEEVAVAMDLFGAAEGAYLAAAGQAPSDKRIYLGLAGLCGQAAQTAALYAGADPTAWIDRMLAYARKAALVDPSDPFADCELASAYLQMGQYQRAMNRDPREALGRSLEFARSSLAKKADFSDGYVVLGAAQLALGAFETSAGRDATTVLRDAIRHLRRGAELDPDNRDRFAIELGSAFYAQARQDRVLGRDPRPSLEVSVANIRRALALNPDDPGLLSNLGFALSEVGSDKIQRGADPGRELGEALRAFTDALRRSPTLGIARVGSGMVHDLLGRHLHATGGDPTAEYRRAIAEFTASEAIYMEPLLPLRREASTLSRMADYLLQSRQDPSEALATLRGLASGRLLKRPGTEALSLDLQGLADLKAGEWSLRQGLSPEPRIANAQRLFQRALGKDAKLVEARVNLGRSERIRAEWALARKASAKAPVLRGLSVLDAVLEEQPLDLAALADRGALRLLMAEASPETAEKARWAGMAAQDLGRVLERDAFYRREYGPLLDEARSLGAQGEPHGAPAARGRP